MQTPAQVEERQLDSVTTSPPVRRGRSLALLALLIVSIVLVIVVARQWPFTRQAVLASLQQQSGSAVEIGAFHQFYFPHPGCVAEAVTVRKDVSTPPLITIQKLTIVGSYAGLLTHHLSMIRAEGFHVSVRKQSVAPGSFGNVGRISSGLTIAQLVADGSEVEIVPQQQGQTPLVFRIPRLVLRNIADSQPLNFESVVQLPKPAAEVTVAGKFGPWQPDHGGQTLMSGAYSVRELDLGDVSGLAGKIVASGKFDGELQSVRVQGSLDAPGFEVRQSKHPVHLAALYIATVNGLNGDINVDAARAHFSATTLFGAGTISNQGEASGKTANIELWSKQARIEDLLWLCVSDNPPSMTGAIVFRANVQIPPGSRPCLRKTTLQGDFGISNAQYPNPETQKDIDILSARARGEAGKVEHIQDKVGKNDYGPGRVVSNLKGHVTLIDGVAHLSNVSFDVPGASAVLSGNYSLLTERIDLSGHMHMVADLPNTTTGFKSMLLRVMQPFLHKSKSSDSVVAIRIGGTYDHPTYAVVPKARK